MNLPAGAIEPVHMVAFTPKPRLIKLQLVPNGTRAVSVGELCRPATRYVLKPILGPALRLFATILGKAPANHECLIVTEEVPAFIRCDGPLYPQGPIWRIDLASPR